MQYAYYYNMNSEFHVSQVVMLANLSTLDFDNIVNLLIISKKNVHVYFRKPLNETIINYAFA